MWETIHMTLDLGWCWARIEDAGELKRPDNDAHEV